MCYVGDLFSLYYISIPLRYNIKIVTNIPKDS